jgi:hypothetical protein
VNDKLFGIYLNDHLAGATAGVEIARRATKSNRGSEYEEFLAALSEEIDSDRRTLRATMDELGVGVDRAKQAAAWSAEKLGRLKPNGRLGGYSPLSRLVELEFLTLGITGKLAMWRVIADTVDTSRVSADIGRMIERAERQRSEVEPHRLRAAEHAFGDAG